MVTFHFVPYQDIENLGSAKRVNKLLNIVKEDKIVIMEGRLRKEEEAVKKDRKEQIGTADRSEKIRTYNFPDRRGTDHRIGLTLHQLEQILDGHLEELVAALHAQDQAQQLT